MADLDFWQTLQRMTTMMQHAQQPDRFVSASHEPGSGTRATVTLASPGPGKALMIIVAEATLRSVLAGVGVIRLRAGASGAGATMWVSIVISAATLGGQRGIENALVAPENSEVTLEYDAAGNTQTVSLVARIVDVMA